jgi:cell division protein FtsB
MKNLIKKIIWPVIFLLIFVNIYLFVSGISLSDQINIFEKKTENLKKENLSLEKEVAYLSSLNFAQEIAKQWQFTDTPVVLNLEKLKYAFKP